MVRFSVADWYRYGRCTSRATVFECLRFIHIILHLSLCIEPFYGDIVAIVLNERHYWPLSRSRLRFQFLLDSLTFAIGFMSTLFQFLWFHILFLEARFMPTFSGSLLHSCLCPVVVLTFKFLQFVYFPRFISTRFSPLRFHKVYCFDIPNFFSLPELVRFFRLCDTFYLIGT